MAGVFALFHGVAHGAELGGHGAFGFAAGFIAATAALHAAGFGIGYALNKNVWVLRIVGSAIGLAGLGMLAA
jgi:urease accessory protein